MTLLVCVCVKGGSPQQTKKTRLDSKPESQVLLLILKKMPKPESSDRNHDCLQIFKSKFELELVSTYKSSPNHYKSGPEKPSDTQKMKPLRSNPFRGGAQEDSCSNRIFGVGVAG